MSPRLRMLATTAVAIGLVGWASITVAAEQNTTEGNGADLDATGAHVADQQAASTQATLARIRADLARRFDNFLSEPTEYEARVLKECREFPEGRLYPYLLPALGYAHLAFRTPSDKEHARREMAKLIDLAVPKVAEDVKAPHGELRNLKTYQDHATYLGTLNLALGSFRLATGDTRYDDLHNHVSRVLYEAILAEDGWPIRSYPTYSWNFDTITALASLDLHDRIHGRQKTRPLVEEHLAWIDKHCTHQDTGLPYSTGCGEVGQYGLPRGCELSFRICLMSTFAPDQARTLYAAYTKSHWIDLGIISGFSEWPRGMPGAPDIDSGPIFMGIGLTATGMGLGAVEVCGDTVRQDRLALQLGAVESLMKLANSNTMRENRAVADWLRNSGIALDPAYFTGFLYGDAALFCAVMWIQYPETGVTEQ